MPLHIKLQRFLVIFLILYAVTHSVMAQQDTSGNDIPLPISDAGQERIMLPYRIAVVQTLDKITGKTQTRELEVGETVSLGPLFGVIRACRKAPPIEEPESAAFIQVWEPIINEETQDLPPQDKQSRWVFSGWMFASSPALSAMDHPVYDIWVLDCIDQLPTSLPVE